MEKEKSQVNNRIGSTSDVKVYRIRPSVGRTMVFQTRLELESFRKAIAEAEVEELTLAQWWKEAQSNA